MKTVPRDEYRQILLGHLATAGLPEFAKRWDLSMILNDPNEKDCIMEGSLQSDSLWSPPSQNLLVLGDIHTKFLDLRRTGQDDWDGGSLFVFGDVKCSAMRLHFNTFVFVQGSLFAEDCLITAYEDAGIVILGDLRTKFMHGYDIWAEVGGTASMDYGTGYCLPHGYTHSEDDQEMKKMVTLPIHGEEQSLAVLPDEAKSEFAGVDSETLWRHLITGGRLNV